MQKALGVVCLIGGLLLIFWGHNMAESVGGQLQNAFTGSPGDKPMWLYVGGTVLCVIGLFQIFTGRK